MVNRELDNLGYDSMIKSIADFVPDGVEAGVGLVLQDEAGRYLFFLAGTRHHCPPGELFYAGIGGHREPGEDWLACAQREAREEIGTEIEILSAAMTWLVPQQGSIQVIETEDRPWPLAFYEMIHLPDAPRAGEVYRLVIYLAKLKGKIGNLPPDEVQGVIALTREQVLRGLEHQSTLAELVREGALLVASDKMIDLETRLYPIGTARALAQILASASAG
jgi:ADP-ribose pyrophosphatase YjhB (NUDIX family)